MNPNERRICWFSTLLIVLLATTPKLLALRNNGIMAHFWRFNLGELLFQMAINLLFCWILFQINLNNDFLFSTKVKTRYSNILTNGIAFLVSLVIGSVVQYNLFPSMQTIIIYWFGYLTRLALSGILVGIVIKIVSLMREGEKKDNENERLKLINIETELELLKEQMNPHFLFNSLSSLSGIIREDPELAQKYVKDISTVFRYALNREKSNLASLADELEILRSFAELVSMRLEKAFSLNVNVDEAYLTYQLPHLSLQPLLENAVKHNAATIKRPLKVDIYIEDNHLIIANSLNEIRTPDTSNGIGLSNLNERFRIMMHQDIEILKNDDRFTVKLPLKA